MCQRGTHNASVYPAHELAITLALVAARLVRRVRPLTVYHTFKQRERGVCYAMQPISVWHEKNRNGGRCALTVVMAFVSDAS